MPTSMNLSLTDELRDFVNSRVRDGDVYSTPSEYFRDLIRRDMETQATVCHIREGIADIKEGRYSDKPIMDITGEETLHAHSNGRSRF